MNLSFSELKKLITPKNKVLGSISIKNKSMPVTKEGIDSMEKENPTLTVVNGKLIKF